MIKLPNLDWFMGMLKFRGAGNYFSGSAGCDPQLGNLESKVFRYRVWVRANDDGFELVAVHYCGLYSYEATDKNIMTEKIFTADAQGIAEAQEWLQIAQDNAVESFK
jgi:hypothetical protein